MFRYDIFGEFSVPESLCIFTDYIYVYNHSERCVGATIRPVVE